MLDMGFEKDMRWILDQMPKERQSMMFSATFPGTVKALSRKLVFVAEIIGLRSISSWGLF